MKVRLSFKSGKEIIDKDVELSASILMSLLNDEFVIEIAKQVGSGVYQNGGYLFAITDMDGINDCLI